MPNNKSTYDDVNQDVTAFILTTMDVALPQTPDEVAAEEAAVRAILDRHGWGWDEYFTLDHEMALIRLS